jgi:hypothetical protein
MHVLVEEIKERSPLFARCGTPKQYVERVDLASKDVQITFRVALMERIAEANRVA